MGTLWQDIRYGFRMLRKSPGFAVLAMLTLALGIGANLALFGILNEMLLRPKPVARPHELWAAVPADESGQQIGALVYRPYYDAISREGRLFQDVIGYAGIRPKIRMDEGNERIWAELVAGDYFSFLGVVPVLGRGFLPEEKTETGRSAVAVISHAFWQSYFGGMRDVLGKTVTLNDAPLEIVGVAPPGFAGLDCFGQPSLWIPANMETVLEKKSTSYEIVGRLTEPKLARTVEEHLTPIAADITKGLSESKFPDLSLKGISPITQIRLEPIGRGLLGTSYIRPKIIRFLQFLSLIHI